MRSAAESELHGNYEHPLTFVENHIKLNLVKS